MAIFKSSYARCAALLVMVAMHGLASFADAETSNAEPTAEKVDLEVFTGPRSKKLSPPPYPIGERSEANEGWVNLSFMIDPHGKPYEITVDDSTGIEAFEKAAIETAKRWEFEPATLNGTPIDSGHTVKVMFRITDPETGASADFVSAYRKAISAIEAKDQGASEAALARLKVTNLYEDAYLNIARYSYFQVWGDLAKQIDSLEHAIAHEGTATFLPKATFENGLLSLMRLKLDSQDFAGVLNLWKQVQSSRIKKEKLKPWEPVIADIEALRRDDRAYAVQGSFGRSTSWNYPLHKRHFRIEVASGHIAEVKLRCEKKYVLFRFDPTLQYTLNDRYGLCSMELIGDPETRFSLIQS